MNNYQLKHYFLNSNVKLDETGAHAHIFYLFTQATMSAFQARATGTTSLALL